MLSRTFWRFFALGMLVVLLNTSFLRPWMPGAVLDLLATPGVLLSLPLHNVGPGGGVGVVSLISLTNGLVYGLAAWLVARLSRRKRPDGTE